MEQLQGHGLHISPVHALKVMAQGNNPDGIYVYEYVHYVNPKAYSSQYFLYRFYGRIVIFKTRGMII